MTKYWPFRGSVPDDVIPQASVIDLDSSLAALGVYPYKSGWWVMPSGGYTTGIPTEAQMHLTRVIIPKACSIDRLACEVTAVGSAGALIRLGMYAADADGLPGALVVDGGTVVGDSGTGVKEATVGASLSPGVHYLAAVVQGAAGTRPTMRTSGATSNVDGILTNSAAATGFTGSGYRQETVTGALPASWTPGAGIGSAIRVAARYV